MKSHNGLAKKENFLETPIYKINEWCKKHSTDLYSIHFNSKNMT